MALPRHSPLFRAIVLTGVSLTACGKEALDPPDAATSGADAAPSSNAAKDAGTAEAEAEAPDAACPPGSERPVPPCYFIR